MRLANVQPEETHPCMFIRFTGDIRAVEEGKGTILCVRLDEQGELHDFRFLRKGQALQLSHAAEQAGTPVLYRTLKLRAEHMGTVVYELSDSISIVQRETEHAYEIVLRHTEKQAETGRRKQRRRKPERAKVTEHVIRIVPKGQEKKRLSRGCKPAAPSGTRTYMLLNTKEINALYTANAKHDYGTIRIRKMRSFEEDMLARAVSFRFLGPGDRLFPLPRAEPCTSLI